LWKQGQVYSAIIEEVINSSRIDFEEAGINASTLDDLKAVSGFYLFMRVFCSVAHFRDVGWGNWGATVVGCCLLDLVLFLHPYDSLADTLLYGVGGEGLLYSAWAYGRGEQNMSLIYPFGCLFPYPGEFARFYVLGHREFLARKVYDRSLTTTHLSAPRHAAALGDCHYRFGETNSPV
jgi:hypothetical protein